MLLPPVVVALPMVALLLHKKLPGCKSSDLKGAAARGVALCPECCFSCGFCPRKKREILHIYAGHADSILA